MAHTGVGVTYVAWLDLFLRLCVHVQTVFDWQLPLLSVSVVVLVRV